MGKIHMESAVDRDDVEGKTKTLCGLHLGDNSVLVKNPDGIREVTCENCIRIIDNFEKGTHHTVGAETYEL